MEKKELLISTNGPIATLTLNRPDQRNTLTPKLLAGIHLTLEKWAAGDTIRTVVVTGEAALFFPQDMISVPYQWMPILKTTVC